MTEQIEQFGKGAVEDLSPDPRNFKYESLVMAAELTPFDWSKGFSVEEKTGRLKVDHQNGSLSCTGQAWKKYKVALDIIEEMAHGDIMDDLSAKDIYSRTFIDPTGGAYIMSGAKLLTNRGVCKEKTNPSYQNGFPPSEVFMRELRTEGDAEASAFGTKSYAYTTHNDMEFLAQMIRDNNGVVTGFTGSNGGWATADIRPPRPGEKLWGHAIYLIGAGMRNGRQAIEFINSWGEGWGDKGHGYFYADSLGYMFDIWTLVDKTNPSNSIIMKTIGDASNQKDIYIIGADGKIHLIYNLATQLGLHNMGIIDKNIAPAWEDISGYERADDIIMVNAE